MVKCNDFMGLIWNVFQRVPYDVDAHVQLVLVVVHSCFSREEYHLQSNHRPLFVQKIRKWKDRKRKIRAVKPTLAGQYGEYVDEHCRRSK